MTNLVSKENNQAIFTFSVDKKSFTDAVVKAYNQNKKKYKVPGFRPGKAPKKVIENYYGEGVFYNDALNIVIPDLYDKAVEELKLNPVAQADIDIKKFDLENDNDIEIEAKVFVRPEIELNNYKGLDVEVETKEVTDEDIDQVLKEEANKNSRLISVDREAKLGDVVIIDFKGFINDEAFEGGDGTNFELELGSHSFIDNFEDQLVGTKSNDEKEVFVKFPDDYHAEDLKGKEAKFEVKIHEVKEKEIPEINDDFAKDVSEFDTIEEYKKSIREEKQKFENDRINMVYRENLMKKIIDNLDVDIPKVMIDNETENMLREFDYRLRYQGLSLQQYLQFSNLYADDLKEKMKEDAIKRIKTNLVLLKVVELENLKASQEEIDKEIEEISKTQRLDFEKVKEVYARDNFEEITLPIETEKAFDFLAENSKCIKTIK